MSYSSLKKKVPSLHSTRTVFSFSKLFFIKLNCDNSSKKYCGNYWMIYLYLGKEITWYGSKLESDVSQLGLSKKRIKKTFYNGNENYNFVLLFEDIFQAFFFPLNKSFANKLFFNLFWKKVNFSKNNFVFTKNGF